MKKLSYDKEGMGAAELMFLALYHPVLFVGVAFLIKHNVKIMSILRKFL